MYELSVIGDVHGESGKLRSALTDVLENSSQVVLVGDYINRGANSRDVLDILIRVRAEYGPSKVSFLRGNHENALLEFLRGGSAVPFLRHGGLSTVQSYLCGSNIQELAHFAGSFPADHREVLEDMPAYIETDEMLISHCGYDPENMSARSHIEMTEGSFPEIFAPGARRPRPLVICGHYVQRGSTPYDADGLICLDVGCGSIIGAPLAAVHLPDRTFSFYR